MENGIQSDLIRGHVNTIILKALYEGDKYGYEICKEITERSVGQYELKQPTLYSCLKRLEKQGWIKSYWGTTATNGGRRRYYTLSDLGRDMYLKSQAEWEYSRTLIDRLVSDKPYDLTAPPPAEINLKIVPVKRRVAAEEESEPEAEADLLDDEVEEEPSAAAEEETERSAAAAREEGAAPPPPSPPHVVQYDLFDKIKVDVDKNIQEYEKVSKLYEEANIRTEEPEEQPEQVHTSRNVGFDANGSRFIDVPTDPAEAESAPRFEEEPLSYTEAILSESALKAREILFSKPQQPLELQTFESDDALEEPLPASAAPPLSEAEAPAEPEAEEEEEVLEEPAFPVEERAETKAEKEYKNILNKLLNTAKSHTAANMEDMPPMAEPQAEEQPEPAESEVALTGTNITTYEDRVVVDTGDYSLIPHRQRSSMDFSELQAKLQTEGFKVRAHSKESEVPSSGLILTNKVMFTTLFTVFLFVAAELLVIYFAGNSYLGLPNATYITIGSVAVAMFLASVIFYAVNPRKKARDRFQFGVSFGLACILTALAFIASFAVALLAASQLSVTAELFRNVLLPTVLALNMPIGVLIYAILRKQKNFRA